MVAKALVCAFALAGAASAELIAPSARPALKLRGGFKPTTAVAPRGSSLVHKASGGVTELLAAGAPAVDVQLLLYFLGWYVGNYYYTLNNK